MRVAELFAGMGGFRLGLQQNTELVEAVSPIVLRCHRAGKHNKEQKEDDQAWHETFGVGGPA